MLRCVQSYNYLFLVKHIGSTYRNVLMGLITRNNWFEVKLRKMRYILLFAVCYLAVCLKQITFRGIRVPKMAIFPCMLVDTLW